MPEWHAFRCVYNDEPQAQDERYLSFKMLNLFHVRCLATSKELRSLVVIDDDTANSCHLHKVLL